MKTFIKSAAVITAFAMTSCTDDFKEVPSPTGSTITEVVAADENLDVFAAALDKIGMSAVLGNNNAGTYTVFAPSDDAFVAYLKAKLVADPFTEADAIAFITTTMSSTTAVKTADINSIVTYAIVSSSIPSSEIEKRNTFVTLASTRLSISKETDIFLNASAKVLTSDAVASNGVVYTTDKVLIPFSTSGTGASALAWLGMSINYGTNPPTISGGTEAGADTARLDFDVFAYAVRKGNVASIINPNVTPLPDFTLFIPNDGAFRDMFAVATDAEAIAALKAMSADDVAAMVKRHIITGRLVTTDFSSATSFPTLSPPAAVNVDGSTVRLVDGSNSTVLLSKNILTNAGVIHTLKAVLKP